MLAPGLGGANFSPGGGTEYTNVQCGVSLATIQAETLVIANVGLAMLISLHLRP
jgi:hypothetical protein